MKQNCDDFGWLTMVRLILRESPCGMTSSISGFPFFSFHIPHIPDIPHIPEIPDIPHIPDIPQIPEIFDLGIFPVQTGFFWVVVSAHYGPIPPSPILLISLWQDVHQGCKLIKAHVTLLKTEHRLFEVISIQTQPNSKFTYRLPM